MPPIRHLIVVGRDEARYRTAPVAVWPRGENASGVAAQIPNLQTAGNAICKHQIAAVLGDGGIPYAGVGRYLPVHCLLASGPSVEPDKRGKTCQDGPERHQTARPKR